MQNNIYKMKQEICDIGLRVYNKGFAAANDGNISYRVSENEVLCTPTMHCKGFLKPDDICTVDMTGKQIAGRKQRTSEVLLHLDIYKAAPQVRAVVHCHPPHATAFSIAGQRPGAARSEKPSAFRCLRKSPGITHAAGSPA